MKRFESLIKGAHSILALIGFLFAILLLANWLGGGTLTMTTSTATTNFSGITTGWFPYLLVVIVMLFIIGIFWDIGKLIRKTVRGDKKN